MSNANHEVGVAQILNFPEPVDHSQDPELPVTALIDITPVLMLRSEGVGDDALNSGAETDTAGQVPIVSFAARQMLSAWDATLELVARALADTDRETEDSSDLHEESTSSPTASFGESILHKIGNASALTVSLMSGTVNKDTSERKD